MKNREKHPHNLYFIYWFMHLDYQIRLRVSHCVKSLKRKPGNSTVEEPPVKPAHYSRGFFLVPVFFACIGSLVFCAILSLSWHGFQPRAYSYDIHHYDTHGIHSYIEENHAISVEIAQDNPDEVAAFTWSRAKRRDIILELYRDPESQERVIAFFAEFCPSQRIAEVILANADFYDIAPALAFALAWEESRLNPRAVNSRNHDGSIDRGLFQLNNFSFPRLEIQSFFDSDLNARYGMSHLRFCLETGGTEVSALAMYNAGAGRVRSAGTPKTTLDYASRILENRWEIENLFREREAWFQEQMQQQMQEEQVQLQDQIETVTEIAESKSERRFIPLKPLGIR